MTDHDEIVFRPLFEPSLASRYLGAETREIKRWLQGYKRGSERKKGIVVRNTDDPSAVNFMEFVELLYIKALRGKGVSFDEIRRVYQLLAEEFGYHEYAFARQKTLYVFQKRVLVDFLDQKLEHSGQLAFSEVVHLLGDQIKFVNDLPREWWPLTQERTVVMTPGVCGSAPSCAESRVTTGALYDLYKAEGRRVEPVIRWFGVSERELADAIEFEESIRNRKAA